MEDRHYLSEARPVRGLEKPTWDVDIMREGVDVPIMTIRVDEKVLPPRRRKKKVVWKLPDDVDQIPKFGKEDRLRILDYFKQQKKEIKREKRKTQPNNDDVPTEEQQNGDDMKKKEEPQLQPQTPNFGAKPPPPSSVYPTESNGTNGRKGATISAAPKSSQSPDDEKHKSMDGPKYAQNATTLGPLAFDGLSLDEKKQSEVTSDPHSFSDFKPAMNGSSTNQLPFAQSSDVTVDRSMPHPPPGINGLGTKTPSGNSTPLSPSHPPGLDTLPPGLGPGTNAPPPRPPPGLQHPGDSTRTTSTSSQYNDNNNYLGHHSVPSPRPKIMDPRCRYFQVPLDTGNNSDVNLAQVVTQSYYVMLTHGHVHDLQLHYAPSAAKSLTVGGAHAICHSSHDIERQLQSLVGMIVAIRGVLQQSIPDPTGAGLDSIMVVITGMCVRPHALPFCHSLVLVPSMAAPSPSHNKNNISSDDPITFGYQIQNDALCFLTNEDQAAATAGTTAASTETKTMTASVPGPAAEP